MRGSSISSGIFPRASSTGALAPRIAEARIGELATLEVTVDRAQAGRREPAASRAPYRVLVEDDSGRARARLFQCRSRLSQAPAAARGAAASISGKLESYDGWLQMPHPDHVVAVDGEGGTALPLLEPIYPLTAGLTNTTLRKAIAQRARRACPTCRNGSTAGFLAPECLAAVSPRRSRACMRRQTEADLLPSAPARARLAYDELLANQLALAVIRARLKRARRTASCRARASCAKPSSPRFPSSSRARKAARLAEIDADLASPSRMLRLLQGDVGSGKTVVALLAMASRGRGRSAGGLDGADRAAGAPASSRPSAASPLRPGLAHCAAHRPRARTRAQRDP